MQENNNQPILTVDGLVIKFLLRGRELTAIRGISLDLYKGESLAIVGESGSGKSVFIKSFMGLLDNNGWVDAGSILYNGTDLAKLKSEKEWLAIREKRIAMVFQDPMTSLNPLKTIGSQIMEAILINKKVSRKEAKERTYELMRDVGIDQVERRFRQYPHEFSGGMRQRIVIAIAIACEPEILLCDEPTTALDVTIQAQILKLIQQMQQKYGLTIIYITHDLGVVAQVADRVAVMYAGDLVEIGTCREVFFDPKHPYTWALLSSLPQLGVKGDDLVTIPGTPPNLYKKIVGDAFAPRNRYALKVDFLRTPPYFQVSETHRAKTWLLDPRAPAIEPPANVTRLREEGGLLNDIK